MVLETPEKMRMSLLALIEASQSAVESSDKALRAAEKALTAAQIANTQAKDVLKAVSEAFIQEDRKMMTILEVERESEIMDCDSDGDFDDMKNFVMLSTNNIPVNDVEDEDSTSSSVDEDENFTSPRFYLISSTGAAADHQCDTLGLYRQSEAGHSVYNQEECRDQDSGYCDNPYKLYNDNGVWMVISSFALRQNRMWILLCATTPSESPTTVKWQYYDRNQNIWLEDPTLSVTSLSERPTCDCEVTIRLSKNIARNIGEPVTGVYRPDGTYYEGRPVLWRSSGNLMLYVSRGRWRLGYKLGDDGVYLCSKTVLSLCPADPRAAIYEPRQLSNFGYRGIGASASITCSNTSCKLSIS